MNQDIERYLLVIQIGEREMNLDDTFVTMR